ncbi:MAG: MFS transporter [Jatrophihabitans sp.]|nr:MAG: MFS transporter [Jatrophihabitans sp.]
MTAAAASRWSVLAGFAGVAAVTQLLWLTYAPITTQAARHYGVSESAIGWLANVLPLGYVVLAVPAGLLLDRGFRPWLLVGAVLTACAGIVRLVGDDYDWQLAGQALLAIAQPFVLTAITGVAGRYLRPADRATGIAIGTASTFAGMIVAFVLAAAVPLRAVLATDAILGVAALVCVAVPLRKGAAFRHDRTAPGLRALRATWRDPLVRRLCLLVFVPFGTFTALTTWAEALLDPAGVTSSQAGIVLLVNIVAGVAGCALLPVAAVRRRRELAAMAAALLVTAASCALLAAAPGLAMALATFAVFGFLLLPCLPIVLELTERRGAGGDSTAAGLIWLFGQAGALVVTGVVGTVVHHPLGAFVLMAAVTFAAVPLLRSLAPYVAVLPRTAPARS